ncbi:MAG TPA: hypothetical protein PKK06_07740 [Phycisphaerae bacterium]|nr:hypothetical protein [Phycisphaerae bacterium]HNU46072.1 hypothetical protein [Phycisphaerae bacterium]
MNCDEFRLLLAEAWGGELAGPARAEFEAHRQACTACGREYDSGRATLDVLRELSGPRAVRLRREGARLVFEDVAGVAAPVGGRRPRWASVSRYAAGLLLAFVGGYGLHAGLMLSSAGPVSSAPAEVGAAPSPRLDATFEAALARAHYRNPTASGLAKCVTALAAVGRAGSGVAPQ